MLARLPFFTGAALGAASEATAGAPRGERFRAMYDDPKFHYPNTPEGKAKLLADLNGQVQVITKKLPQYFGKLPRMPYGVRPIAEQISPDTTTAYYQGPAMDGSRAG